MAPFILALALAAPNFTPLPVASRPVPPGTLVHLGISLRFTHVEELERLKRAQQDPRSADFRRWLTPEQFGARFGQPEAVYGELAGWLEAQGLKTTPSKNKLFLEALGTAAEVEHALGITFVPVDGEPASVHDYRGTPTFPPAFQPEVLNVSGLDTTQRFHHHLGIGGNYKSMGPQDLRRFYGVQGLLDRGFAGQGQKLVVLSTALAPGQGIHVVSIEYFLRDISDAKAAFVQHVMPNPQGDYDQQAGGAGEYELDVQMQSIGSPNADSITLEVPPSSEVFTTGVNDIVNTFPEATAVSISLGICEQGERQNDQMRGTNEIGAMRQGIIQGVMEGQTWSAATGDNGANDCRDNRTVAADFPSVIPEMMALGGSSIPSPQWNVNKALTAWQTETVWNDGANGGAAGGGRSILFPLPAYQADLFDAGTGGRSVPDVSLIAGLPGAAECSSVPPGQLDPAQGTSVASPLFAGFFGNVAARLGCRLGDVHAALYALGAAQQDGGAAVYHDITSGNLSISGVPGPAAGPGYDSASGWGSLDVTALADALVPCPPLPDGGVIVSPTDGGPAFDQCANLGCDAGSCLTLGDGPSSCLPRCDKNTGAGCPEGSVCNGATPYAFGTQGSCVPGCTKDADCASQPGTVCSLCAQICISQGSTSAHIGDECTTSADCPSGAYCTTSRLLGSGGGYCTQDCDMNATAGTACSCPAASQCGLIGFFQPQPVCLGVCGRVGQPCGRDGFICQPQPAGDPVCLPTCVVRTFGGQSFDTCAAMGTELDCDLNSGICGGPPPPEPPPDAGPPPDITLPAVATDLPRAKVCGCSAAEALPLGWLFALVALRRRVRSR